jgi:iron complex outermembrane receptor protein
MKRPSNLLLFAAAMAVSATMPATLFAENETIEEVVVTGSRAKPRTTTDSAVPIDTFNSEQLDLQPHGDMTETIRNLVPSFTATPLTGDGSSFVRSTSLRGLPPDDVLLLVNSKRRHRSALIQHFGAAMSAGAHASDMGQIPSIALRSVEVLRDGAAAQYGSDAIAGVLNFILKDNDDGGKITIQGGEFFDGEDSFRVAGNIGFALPNSGFASISAEYSDSDQLIRGFQPAAAQAAIDAGIANVGNDSPYSGDNLAQTWGRPESHGLRTAWNIGLPLDGGAELYAFGNFAETYGNYRFFYRAPGTSGNPNDNHSSLRPLPIDPTDPSQGNFCWCDSLIGGYTPYLEGDMLDFSQVVGLKGEFSNGVLYDFSGSYGMNRIDYKLNNTLSPTYGPNSPRRFRPGDLKQWETNLNADFSYPLSDSTNLAFGAEWRKETYEMIAGSAESWVPGPWAEVGLLIDPVTGSNYSSPPNGSNGLAGTPADSAGSFTRRNYAVYADLEWEASEDFLVQGALRFEDFSDFGTTTNGKVAARYHISNGFTLRGAVSTGFRAPTPGQSNLETIVTTFDTTSGTQTNEGTVRPTDPLIAPLGGKALDAEDSFNVSLGFAADIGDLLTLTVDWYQIEVDDRIVKTFNIDVSGDPTFDDSGFSSLAFYTNGLETETTGVDIVVSGDFEWNNGSSTAYSLAWNHNETEVTRQNQVNGVNPVTSGSVFNIENNLPENRFNVTVNQYFQKFSLTVRANWYDETVDERNAREKVDDAWLVDIEGRYPVNDAFTVVAGANNVFDEYPNKIQTRLGNGLSYPRRTPIGYDGGMWYLKLEYLFD